MHDIKLIALAYYYQQLFTFEEIDKFNNDGALIDARQGGLIIGPSHDQGGVYFLFEYVDGFRLFGEVEGYEYIINKHSAEKYRQLLGILNKQKGDFYEYPINESIMVIDAQTPNQNFYNSKFIILDVRGGFAIINKYATKTHLEELDFINRT